MKVKKSLISICALAIVLVGCNKELVIDTLSGDGSKTPLVVNAQLSNEILTRASDKTFASGDVLPSYMRHVTWNGYDWRITGVTADEPVLVTSGSPTAAFKSPSLILFTKGSAAMVADGVNAQKTDDLSVAGGLYWDDFSDSSIPAYDLRTENHYLQSYYGYCYNGGPANVTTALTEATGVLGWTVPTDQTTAANLQNADLLWSKSQTPVGYSHSPVPSMTIPYTHAMSRVSVILIGNTGFDAGDFANTTVTLKGFNKTGTFTATTASISATGKGSSDPGEVQMFGAAEGTTDAKPSRVFQAMTVPQTSFTDGSVIASISDVDGNNYELKITTEMITALSTQLETVNTTPNCTKQGVHYKFTVVLDKKSIDVIASISDWDNIEAETNGTIMFSADVTSTDQANSITADQSAFDMWRVISTAGTTNTAYGAKATTATFDNDDDADETEDTWVCSPVLYWANASTSYYFRALCKYEESAYKSVSGSTDVAQGTDLIWGTTAAHNGTTASGTVVYTAGQAINPRTGLVPMAFQHQMSKVNFVLETLSGDSSVNLDGATITLTNMYNDAVINLHDGSMSFDGKSVTTVLNAVATTFNSPVAGKASLNGLLMVPQSITDAAKLTITLADGTTYSAQLNNCVVSGSDTKVNSWVSGTNYTYTITLVKGKISFLALIKDWNESTASGDATLDWD